MATFTKINDFVLDVAEGEHQLDSDQLVVALSNTAPGAESSNPTADGNGVLANVTEISYTNCSSRNITTSASAVSSGTYKLTLDDITLTASGGSVGPFRYIYIYNSEAAVKTNPIIGYYDYGSAITLNDTDQLTINFDDSNGFITLA